MATNLDFQLAYQNSTPILFWVNRKDPLLLTSMSRAVSGKMAIVRTNPSGLIGQEMKVRFYLARKSHLDTWYNLITANPFATTSLYSTFSTGRTVIFNPNNPIIPENMVLKDKNYDLDQTIFTSGNAAYKKGFDLWEGELNLIITA